VRVGVEQVEAGVQVEEGVEQVETGRSRVQGWGYGKTAHKGGVDTKSRIIQVTKILQDKIKRYSVNRRNCIDCERLESCSHIRDYELAPNW